MSARDVFVPGRSSLGRPVNPPKPQAGAAASPPTSPPVRVRGRVVLWSPETTVQVVAQHAELPQISGERAGGWAVIDVPSRTSIVDWTGSQQPLRMALTLLLDRPGAPAALADDLLELRSLAARDRRLGRPPRVRVIGAVPFASPTWGMDTLEIAEEMHDPATGRPVRVRATIGLLEIPAIESEVRRYRAVGSTTYRWRKSDTLKSVARRRLGDARRTDWIRKANPKIKSWAKLKPGTKIKLPKMLR